jgi:hypothetical protein
LHLLEQFLDSSIPYINKKPITPTAKLAKVIGSFSFLFQGSSFHPTTPHIAVTIAKMREAAI